MTNFSDVGPTMAFCYTGRNNVSENFVHVWTIADFKKKMEIYRPGESIDSDNFHIGDTEWHFRLYPSGLLEGSKGVTLCLNQVSEKTVFGLCNEKKRRDGR